MNARTYTAISAMGATFLLAFSVYSAAATIAAKSDPALVGLGLAAFGFIYYQVWKPAMRRADIAWRRHMAQSRQRKAQREAAMRQWVEERQAKKGGRRCA